MIPGVSAQKPFHAGGKVPQRRLEHEMEMAAHEHPGVKVPVAPGASRAEGLHEVPPVLVVAHDVFAPVAATQEVLDRSFELDAWLSRHAHCLAMARNSVNPTD